MISELSAERIPVIVGVGEITDRPKQLLEGLEPIALMEHALRRAEQDAGVALLAELDALDIVNEVSWPYPDALSLLGQRLGITPRHACYGEVGGESPVRFIHEAALRIARGESRVAAVVGAEATHTVSKAQKIGLTLPWAEREANPRMTRGKDLVHPISLAHGIYAPITIYPLYENATLAAWGQTPEQALTESGYLWRRYAQVAAHNPFAWNQDVPEAESIVAAGPQNRLIAWPYTKQMVANPMVNQGAAILLTSLAHARELGIAPEQMVFVHAGAAAREPRDYLAREQLQRSDAQDAVLEAVVASVGGDAQAFTALELYSCFPCVPKMARRTLGLDDSVEATVTGGLSFFGAPLNNYMTHAAAAMVRRLRNQVDGLGLLYGQGEFVTKHHALVLASTAPQEALSLDYSVQSIVEARRGVIPELLGTYEGRASVETFTLVHQRDGAVEFGFVIARTPQGQRLLARVPADDERTVAVLTDPLRSPVGRDGQVSQGNNGFLQWSSER